MEWNADNMDSSGHFGYWFVSQIAQMTLICIYMIIIARGLMHFGATFA